MGALGPNQEGKRPGEARRWCEGTGTGAIGAAGAGGIGGNGPDWAGAKVVHRSVALGAIGTEGCGGVRVPWGVKRRCEDILPPPGLTCG